MFEAVIGFVQILYNMDEDTNVGGGKKVGVGRGKAYILSCLFTFAIHPCSTYTSILFYHSSVTRVAHYLNIVLE